MAEKKLQLEVEAKTSGVEAGIKRAKQAVDSMGDAAQKAGEKAAKMGDGAQQSAQKVDASTKNMIASIQRTIATMEAGGRANSKYFETLAQQRGVDVNALRPYLEQLDKVSEKQRQAAMEAIKSSGAFNKYGKSVKEVELALRGVPAQLTDIFVSLQGGQAPLTVLLQQGGQLRDMFGGIAPAARALGSAVIGLVNPFTVAAAAAAALGAAYFQGSREADAYARALILTGNATGATVGQLQAMAASLDGVVGTQAKAAEVLAALAESGQVASGNLERFAETAIRLERVAGKAVADTVKEFAELGKSPVEAARKLNEQYNFLTFAVYEQIRALEDQGRVAEAAAVAQGALNDTLSQRADQLTERLGYLERAWKAVKDAAAEAWDSMLDVGRPRTPEERLQSLQEQLAQRLQRGPLNSLTGAAFEKGNQRLRDEIALLQDGIRESRRFASAQAETAAQVRAAIEAEKEIDRIRKASMSNQQKLTAELDKYRKNLDAIRRANPTSELLDPRRIAADEAAIRERFQDRAARPKAYQDDAATRMLQQLRESEAVTRAQLEATVKLTGAQKQLAEFEQLIADLKEKRVLTADQKSLMAAQDAIKAQLQKNVAVETELQLKEQRDKEELRRRQELERMEERIAQLRESMGSANEERRAQNDLRIQSFGMGREARERLESEFALTREFRRYREQLDKATPKELLGSQKYRDAVADIEKALKVAKRELERYYAAIKAAAGDAFIGAKEAIQDYLTDAEKAGKQTYDLFTKAFSGIEDALVEFVRTGKLSFSSLIDSMIADIARLTIRQGVASMFDGALDSLFGVAGARADGGPVSAGQTYLVGERGPELFVPKQSGTIVPNHALGSGGVVVNQTVNVGQGVSRAEVFQAVTAANNALKADLLRSRSREGVFA